METRITLTEEICELAARGMTDNYDQVSEHSVMVDHATQAEASPPQGMEELVLPLDTSSQTSVEGMEASVEAIQWKLLLLLWLTVARVTVRCRIFS